MDGVMPSKLVYAPVVPYLGSLHGSNLMAPLSILINGCSIAGPALASFLLLSPLPADQKPHITVIERASTLRRAGQNIDIRGAGVTIARKLGLEGIIRASTTGEEGVQLVDDQGRIWGRFAADKTGKTSTPTADIEILRGTLARILFDRSQQISDDMQRQGGRGIEFVFGDYVSSLEQDHESVHVQLARCGQRRSFDIVVGADGLHSNTRRLAFGASADDTRIKRVGMYGAFFSLPKAPEDTEWRQWYHTTGGRNIMLRPSDRPDRMTAMVAVVNDEDSRLPEAAERAPGEGTDAQKALLAEYFADAGWKCPRIMGEMMEADDFYYDMSAQVHMPGQHWSKGRVVLLGDAGYCASPLSGMGTTLGLVGAYKLAGCILRHPNNLDLAFHEYSREMKPTVDKAQKLAPGMPHLINPQTAWGLAVMHGLTWLMSSSGFMWLLFTVFGAGPPAHGVPVAEYGFRQPEEWPVGENKQ
ncbi:oxidoreductase [Teratosphaeria destructans]|uniref:Oxidoreductase n=1 Tax=Teratosphaeria destructans TaxID=418781 RepID=A0A9W7W4I5_9PEZI|nr:oxidoreductase [Teratosphaeria destructans]